MNGKMNGWNFLHRPKKLSADGSTTLDNLRAEKTKLETRLAQIPGLISQLQNSINLSQQDIDWLNSLNNRRKRKWEKENGKEVEDTTYKCANNIVAWKAQIDTMTNERNRIPEQIKAVDRQLEALIQGESQGLSKGLNAVTAKELGELEVKKTQTAISQDEQLKAIELQKAKVEQEQLEKKMSPTLQWSLIIGGSLLLGLIAYLVYRHGLKAPKVNTATIANAPINPIKV